MTMPFIYPIKRPLRGLRAVFFCRENRLRVLAVDDNRDVADAVAAYLSLHDIESCALYSGRDAIEIGSAWQPQIILMDIWMPRCNGFEAARALRRDPETAGIVIVAHTALDESDIRRHQQNDECDGYLQKGRAPKQMISLLEQLCS